MIVEITIDIDGPLPQFEQLIEQIKAAVIAGVLRPGDALPSIRQLANDLDLNSKTVAKAYQLLIRDLIIETKGYRGTYVHPKARRTASSTCRNGRCASSANLSTSCAKQV
jgi:GntR family transcriptional regulator